MVLTEGECPLHEPIESSGQRLLCEYSLKHDKQLVIIWVNSQLLRVNLQLLEKEIVKEFYSHIYI